MNALEGVITSRGDASLL